MIDFNERSLKYSLGCGYQQEGILKKQFFCNGQYWDEILLGVFKEEWEVAFKKYKAKMEVKK